MASGRATLTEFSRTQSCRKGDARTTIAEPLSAKVQSESCSYRHPTFASNFRVVPRRLEYARRFCPDNCPGGQRRRCLLYAPASDSRVVSVGETVGIDVSEDAKCWSEWQDLNLRPPRPERGALPDCATRRGGVVLMFCWKARLGKATLAK